MKLDTRTELAREYCKAFKLRGTEDGNPSTLTHGNCFYPAQDEIKGFVENLIICAHNDYIGEFYWPFAASRLKTLTIQQSHKQRLVLKDFTELPKMISALNLYGVEIKSFKGIESLPLLKEISFAGGLTECLIEVGVLRLLKTLSLSRIIVFNGGLDHETTEAMMIINAHLTNDDVPECQQHLIEAGLQQFAKL